MTVHYLLFYDKAPDHAARQAPHQAAHRDHCLAAANRGELFLGGNLGDPLDGSALLLFQATSPAVAEAFARDDPYVIHGIVSRWRVRAWQTVVGAGVNIPG